MLGWKRPLLVAVPAVLWAKPPQLAALPAPGPDEENLMWLLTDLVRVRPVNVLQVTRTVPANLRRTLEALAEPFSSEVALKPVLLQRLRPARR